MSIIKIEFPADRQDIAKVLGEALTAISELAGGMGKFMAEDSDSNFADFQEQVIRGIMEKTGLSYEQLTGNNAVDTSSAISQDAGSDDHGQFNKTEIDEQENLVDPANVDTKGVPFNAEFCGKAEKPFYASGKNSGQWKKRQGVDALVYDNWYAAELAKVATSGTGQGEQPSVNTGAAFGGQSNQQQQGGDVNTGEVAPHDAGTLMAWVSEMQAADRITQEQVNNAYTQAGVTMTDVFPGPNKTAETIAQAVRNVHTILVSWA